MSTRFKFGKNWKSFLKYIDEDAIQESKTALKKHLKLDTLEDLSFLDIGSGSGLSSLAAKQLNANVHSFDYDKDSVNCTKELKKKYYKDDKNWTIFEGSILDSNFISSLGKFDIIYSWGVLHHTGNMHLALENALIPLTNNGLLNIAIYNNQGIVSIFWTFIKKRYCSNLLYKAIILSIFIPYFTLITLILGLLKHKNPFFLFSNYTTRGMNIFIDWIDWLGGYPFETAKASEIINFYTSKGLTLIHSETTHNKGCSQFTFKKTVSHT